MALAWNAGWVNSPRGFKSRILRTRSGVRPVVDKLVAPRPTILRRSMGRKVAVVWHASFSIAAGVLYFFFVLPRWPELMGDTSHTLGTVLRIVAGVLIGLAALPVVFTLLRTRRPEFGTPALALTLRTVVDRAARAGRCADHRHRDQRDLAHAGHRGAVAVRHLRRRRGDRAARRLRLLPGVRRRAAAASAEAAQAQGGRSSAAAARPPQGRRKRRKPRRTIHETEDEATVATTSRRRRRRVRGGRRQEPAEVTAAAESRRTSRASRSRQPRNEPETEDDRAPSEAEATNGGLRNRRPSGKIRPA